MKMIIALNNKYLEDKIKNMYINKYEIFIFSTKEQVLKSITYEEEIIVITRDKVKGKVDFIEYLYTIKDKNSKNRIVVILSDLNKEMKEKLFAKEIFNIIVGNYISFDEILENINNPKMIIYKKSQNKSNIFIVTGLRKSGKTILCRILSEEIVKNTNKNVIILDFDFIYPCLDLYVSSDKNYGLNNLIEDIKKEDIKDLISYQSNNIKSNNIKYILNSKNIPIIKNKNIIDLLVYFSNYYDYVIVDTSTVMLNSMYNIFEELNVEYIFCIQFFKSMIREFASETRFIDERLLRKSKFIINKFKGKKELIKVIENKLDIIIYGVIKDSFFIDKYILTGKKIYIRYNLKKLLKSIGVIKFEKVRNEIIYKLINIEEE